MNTVQAIEKIDRYIRARYPLIVITTHEEKRVVNNVKALAERKGKNVVEWAVTTGVKGAFGSTSLTDPVAALIALTGFVEMDDVASGEFYDTPDYNTPTVMIFKDFHGHLDNPVTVRYVKDLALALLDSKHTAVFVAPTFDVPVEFEKMVAVMDWPLPELKEQERVLERVERNLPSDIMIDINGNRETIAKALLGLTVFEAESVLLTAVAATGRLDDSVIPYIIQEKAQVIKRSGALEYYDTDLTPASVGGLTHFKEYAEIKASTFSERAREFGLEPAKGVLLVGVPGTGKSLSAKAFAGGRFPLLRLDFGAIMGSLVGQSEGNMRQALKIAEAVSPCVLWVDEIEKALGGVSGGESDGGTTKRVFGTFLTWLSEKTAPVYVIATANDINSLPAELFRAGRFDDIFFVDLPAAQDRQEILQVHLERRGRAWSSQYENIVGNTWGFTGAELEKVVTSGLELAFLAGRDLSATDLERAVGRVIPISATMSAKIQALREWARAKALQAGEPLEQAPKHAKIERTVEL